MHGGLLTPADGLTEGRAHFAQGKEGTWPTRLTSLKPPPNDKLTSTSLANANPMLPHVRRKVRSVVHLGRGTWKEE